ncbi:MAG TPA: hypothetical protein VF442_06280 [Sphingobium sp.]
MKRLFLAFALAAALSACGTITVVTDSGAYSVPGNAATPPAGTSVALLNGYSQDAVKMVANRIQLDLRQVTDTAIRMMQRHLERNGVKVDQNAPKKVTLKVVNASMYYVPIPFAEKWRTNLDLEAVLGDGTSTSVRAENSAPVAFRGQVVLQRSVEGATMFAVSDMLRDKRFQAYTGR